MTASEMSTTSWLRRRGKQSSSVSLLCLSSLLLMSSTVGFLFPTPSKQQFTQATADDDTEVTVTLSNDDARAGSGGYSVMRQPLHKESWDPTLDPTFKAPETREEEDGQKQDMQWWSNKKSEYSVSGGWSTEDGKLSRSGATSKKNSDPNGDDSLDLFQRSLDTLDFPFVLNALRNECFTTPAKQIVEEALKSSTKKLSQRQPDSIAYQTLTADSPEGVQMRYEAVKEMQWLLDPISDMGGAYYKNRRGYQVTLGSGNPPPLEGLSFDLDSILSIVQDGQILEGPELLEISTTMNAMEDLQLWSRGLQRVEEKEFFQLPLLVEEIELNCTLQTLLEDAFDQDGKLSGKTFPVLGRLRAQVRALKQDILGTLDSLVNMPSIKSKLALESGGPLYSEIASGGGRLVLPMDPKYASQYGIVHDSSRSGKTVYVEPSEVIGPTNELRQTEGELKAEEARVWRSLTEQVWNNRRDLEQSVKAVGQLDLVLARSLLGRKLLGVIPIVKDEGVISLMVS